MLPEKDTGRWDVNVSRSWEAAMPDIPSRRIKNDIPVLIMYLHYIKVGIASSRYLKPKFYTAEHTERILIDSTLTKSKPFDTGCALINLDKRNSEFLFI
jgi:hypothetical protein